MPLTSAFGVSAIVVTLAPISSSTCPAGAKVDAAWVAKRQQAKMMVLKLVNCIPTSSK
jgi:hypothetical protein